VRKVKVKVKANVELAVEPEVQPEVEAPPEIGIRARPGPLDEALTHALLRIVGPSALISDVAPPRWVGESIVRAPWVVVRRARRRRGGGLLPVGVRGPSRAERFAGWLASADVIDCVTPEALARRRAWSVRLRGAPNGFALAEALDAADSILRAHGLASSWGPAGSVAFELASGSATVTEASDLDLVVRAAAWMAPTCATSLYAALSELAVRADVLLETPLAAIALSEYARGGPHVLARTVDGPRLVVHPARREAHTSPAGTIE
jgi:phosphoribosyl-dephospho-CoA transferase